MDRLFWLFTHIFEFYFFSFLCFLLNNAGKWLFWMRSATFWKNKLFLFISFSLSFLNENLKNLVKSKQIVEDDYDVNCDSMLKLWHDTCLEAGIYSFLCNNIVFEYGKGVIYTIFSQFATVGEQLDDLFVDSLIWHLAKHLRLIFL